MNVLEADAIHPQTDGRDIDQTVAELIGDAAHQQAGPVEEHLARISQTWQTLPEPSSTDPTYYDRPMLKEPVWKGFIPAYYFVGGVSGAALALGAAAQLDRSGALDKLVRRCHSVGVIGSSISAALLIADLGRPSRFLYMLRVFRPTSPMNMGAWILASAPSAALTAALFTRRSSGLSHWLGEITGFASGIFGAALATYTGVLVGNSTIPVWQESRRVLPILFGASAAASAGSLLAAMFPGRRTSSVTRVFGVAGMAAELASAYAMEKRAAEVPRVAAPLKKGLSGAMWKSASVLTAAGLITSLPRSDTQEANSLRRARRRGFADAAFRCGASGSRFGSRCARGLSSAARGPHQLTGWKKAVI